MADDSPLLVPMEVKALLVNDQVRTQNFQRWTLRYKKLLTYESPEPEPFEGNDTDFATNANRNGIYLHWTLPAALRRGVHSTAAGTTDFPLVPNRWLVIRLSGPADARVANGWVVESDYVGTDGSSDYVDPFAATIQPTLIGRAVPLPWNDTIATAPFLTAVGPGNLTFNAYQPYVDNVFSMHDPMTGIAGPESISYVVAGWYSRAGDDILANWPGGSFDDALDALGWELKQPIADATASTTVCHGVALDLPWQTTRLPDQPDRPTNVLTVVGNSSIDALTALVEYQKGDDPLIDAQLLEAFQYDFLRLLDEHDGPPLLDEAIFRAWFSAAPGGSYWQVVGKEGDDEPDWLFELNRTQRDFDAAVRRLRQLQWELYAMWWKRGRANEFSTDPPGTSKAQFDDALDPSKAGSLAANVAAALAELRAPIAEERIPYGDTPEALADSIAKFAAAHGLAADQELRRAELEPFWRANDPTLLFLGLRTDLLPREDDAPLPCRFASQVVTGIDYEGTPITAASVGAGMPSPDLTNIPSAVAALATELFFLDPDSATVIAKYALSSSDPAIIDKVAEAIRQHAVEGVAPALVPTGSWTQPWAPLFLMWEAEYYPIEHGNWTFDGETWSWDGTGADLANKRFLRGRIFLTPQATFNFGARLEQYAKDSSDEKLRALSEFLADADEWDFLSQSLNGFTEQLITLHPLPQRLPDGDPATLIESQATHAPDPGPANVLPGDPPRFQPWRSGQFYFRRISIVDRFGQAVEVVNTNSMETFQPIRAYGVVPDKTVSDTAKQRFVQVTPRPLQPARIALTFVANDGDSHALHEEPDVDPVCGWVIPNHVTRSLAIYNPDGAAVGEIIATVDAAGVRRPFLSRYPDGADTSTAALGDFIGGLTTAGNDAFEDLIRVIDNTLFKINPLGGRDDQYLSVLMGRPLALVRVRVRLELDGAAVRDQSWADTFDPNAVSPFPGYTFPIRFGDVLRHEDGLVGYFTGTDYSRFDAVYVKDTPKHPSYIAAIGPGNYLELTFAPGDETYLTMLVDPRVGVHATTGLLPVTSIAVPPVFTANALSAMDVNFGVSPILTESNTEALVMPMPDGKSGVWTWVERAGSGMESFAIAPADGAARFPNVAPVLRAGYLRLSGAANAPKGKRRSR